MMVVVVYGRGVCSMLVGVRGWLASQRGFAGSALTTATYYTIMGCAGREMSGLSLSLSHASRLLTLAASSFLDILI